MPREDTAGDDSTYLELFSFAKKFLAKVLHLALQAEVQITGMAAMHDTCQKNWVPR